MPFQSIFFPALQFGSLFFPPFRHSFHLPLSQLFSPEAVVRSARLNLRLFFLFVFMYADLWKTTIKRKKKGKGESILFLCVFRGFSFFPPFSYKFNDHCSANFPVVFTRIPYGVFSCTVRRCLLRQEPLSTIEIGRTLKLSLQLLVPPSASS